MLWQGTSYLVFQCLLKKKRTLQIFVYCSRHTDHPSHPADVASVHSGHSLRVRGVRVHDGHRAHGPNAGLAVRADRCRPETEHRPSFPAGLMFYLPN